MSSEEKRIFEEISRLSTEQRNQNSINIDKQSSEEILRIINDEDKSVPFAVEKEIPYIAQAVELVVKALKNGLSPVP